MDGSSLAPVGDVELKTVYGHPATSIAAWDNLVAVGDKNGYVTVFDANTREQKFYTAYHNVKVTDLKFAEDGSHIYSVGFDKSTFLTNVANPTSKRGLSCKCMILLILYRPQWNCRSRVILLL